MGQNVHMGLSAPSRCEPEPEPAVELPAVEPEPAVALTVSCQWACQWAYHPIWWHVPQRRAHSKDQQDGGESLRKL